MSQPIRSLDRIRIVSPCDADWDSMIGNNQVRFCRHCNLHVNDLSVMTRADALRLVARSQGRLCLRYVPRPDGGVLSIQGPQQLYNIGRRVSRLAAGAFSATLSLSSAVAQTQPVATASQSRKLPELIHTDGKKQIINDEFRASVSGKITDPEGKLLQGAQVILVNQDSGDELQLTSNGKYLFQFLPAGDYLLWMRMRGFPTVQNKIHVPENRRVRMNVTLEPRQEAFEMMGGASIMLGPEDPLVQAVSQNNLASVSTLISTTLDINASDKSTSMSALAEAVEQGNREITQLLLAHGANVNARSSGGKTAIMFLSNNATPELVRDLLSAGAGINVRDDHGDNALMNAAWTGQPAVLRELINAGSMMAATDAAGETVLLAAARNNAAPSIKLLIDAGADVNSTNEGGETALMLAANDGYEKFKLLIESGAEVNARDHAGKTALMIAATNEDIRLVRVLLDSGAEVDAKSDYGMNALMFAAGGRTPETVKVLIEAGAEVNQADNLGRTALMYAAESGSVEVMRAMLDRSAELDAKSKDGQTPLMFAVVSGDEDSVALLLAAGADLSAKNKEGKTAMRLALEAEDEEVIELLKSRGAPK